MNDESTPLSDGRAPFRGRRIHDWTHKDKVAGLMKTQGLFLTITLAITLAVALGAGAGMVPAMAQDTVPPAPNDLNAPIDPIDNPYHVVDGKVDRGTYNGYRRYHSSCHVCHGPDGLGSSFAPPLIETLRQVDYEGFAEVVVNGRENVGASSNSVMPSFAFDPNVMEHMNDIYGYLRARTDGVLDRGRPQRIPN